MLVNTASKPSSRDSRNPYSSENQQLIDVQCHGYLTQQLQELPGVTEAPIGTMAKCAVWTQSSLSTAGKCQVQCLGFQDSEVILDP